MKTPTREQIEKYKTKFQDLTESEKALCLGLYAMFTHSTNYGMAGIKYDFKYEEEKVKQDYIRKAQMLNHWFYSFWEY